MRFKEPRPGTCRVCGCTDDHACPEGCSWVDRDHTLCSACEGRPSDVIWHLTWIARLTRTSKLSLRDCAKVRNIALAARRRFAMANERYVPTGKRPR
jgi:hypothetical protein